MPKQSWRNWPRCRICRARRCRSTAIGTVQGASRAPSIKKRPCLQLQQTWTMHRIRRHWPQSNRRMWWISLLLSKIHRRRVLRGPQFQRSHQKRNGKQVSILSRIIRAISNKRNRKSQLLHWIPSHKNSTRCWNMQRRFETTSRKKSTVHLIANAWRRKPYDASATIKWLESQTALQRESAETVMNVWIEGRAVLETRGDVDGDTADADIESALKPIQAQVKESESAFNAYKSHVMCEFSKHSSVAVLLLTYGDNLCCAVHQFLANRNMRHCITIGATNRALSIFVSIKT